MALNPHKNNKVDISVLFPLPFQPSVRRHPLTPFPSQSLTEEEQKLFRLYGKLPNKKDLIQNKLKERKYFDSGDYAMSKAGKSDGGVMGGLGREHPSYVFGRFILPTIQPPPVTTTFPPFLSFIHARSYTVLTEPSSRQRSPDTIPHLSAQSTQNPHPGSNPSISSPGSPGAPGLYPTISQVQSGSPVKEPSVLQRGMSVDEQETPRLGELKSDGEDGGDGMPIGQ